MSTFAAYKTYLTAAQTAFAADNQAEALKQIRLARMELAKIPDVEGAGEKATFQRDLQSIEDSIKGAKADSGVVSTRNSPQFATITPASTGSGCE